ncbi:Peroxidasin [Nymphon striatum]|nr:Peroxidasin [Nymphon striatum]
MKIIETIFENNIPLIFKGDDRANEQTDLTVIHTIFMREHNKIAEKVKAARPSWNGDRIFLETRKIMAAIFQNIVYQEYLPAILGKKYVAGDPNLNLNVHQNYDSNTRPVIFNEFATAAFRFGHSQLRDLLPRQGKASVKLSSVYFNPFILYESGNPVQEMTAGMLNEVSMKTDRFFTQQVTDNLFPSPGVKFDLIALNIQRGRDHGLPPYKSYKEHFGGTVNGDIGRATYKALLRAYGNNADAIDLFVGGIAEKKQGGGAVGPLFRKILADQFTRLRLGDRFFFENGLHYSAEAISEIKKVRLSHILCRSADISGTIGEFAMLKDNTKVILTCICLLVHFHAIVLSISPELFDTATRHGIKTSAKRKEDLTTLLREGELKGKGQLTGLTRNNYCRFPFLCELTADEAYRQIDEKNFILSFGVDDKTADDMKSGKIINTTECFLTELQCSDIDNNFRTSNGTCNNVKDPYLGSIFTPFDRILEAEFSGTNDSLRVGPNPRTISRVYNQHVPKKDGRLNLMAMQFGQFLDHDITSTPMTTVFDENKEVIEVNCCDPAQAILVPDCAIITVEGTDDAFTDIRCMNFIRSTPISNVLSSSCKVGPRQQMNQVTSFIDASQVYGSSDDLMKELRLENGFLNVTFLPQSVPREYLPQDGSQCGNNPCFRAGDDRVNEQLDLTVMHTIFMREHNLIAAKITEAQPSWSGDKVFLEARKIMAAIMQNIVYQEYLPATLGQTFIDFNNTLNLKVPQDYNPSVRPVIFNEFATAAFRFGHSQLPDQLPRFRHPSINLSSVFFDPFVLYEPGDPVYELTAGIIFENSFDTDTFITSEVTDNLFPSENAKLDLIALNIQRGRDHGIPPYKKYKENMGSSVDADIENSTLTALLAVYGGEDLIDLFVGGISEKKEFEDAAVGPLFHSMIADQFARLRLGDRFFFDNGMHYSDAAIDEIKKVRLSHILCRNADIFIPIGEFILMASNDNFVNCQSNDVKNGVDVEISGFFDHGREDTNSNEGNNDDVFGSGSNGKKNGNSNGKENGNSNGKENGNSNGKENGNSNGKKNGDEIPLRDPLSP